MNQKITLEITADELKNILLDYYKKLYNDDSVEISFHSKEISEGFYEFKSVQTIVKLKRSIPINLGIGKCTSTLEEEIKKEDIKDILQEALSEYNYEVSYIIFDTEKSCGRYEETFIQFKGLKADLKTKSKQKVK